MNFASTRVNLDTPVTGGHASMTDETNPFGSKSYNNQNNPYAGLFSNGGGHNTNDPVNSIYRNSSSQENNTGQFEQDYDLTQKSSKSYNMVHEDERMTREEDDYNSEYDSEYEESVASDSESSYGDDLSSSHSTVLEGPSLWSEISDYKIIVGMGICMLLVAMAYFYWLSIQCQVEENEQMLLTTQYALDKKSYNMLEEVDWDQNEQKIAQEAGSEMKPMN